jgi:membrane glycosyltransferase
MHGRLPPATPAGLQSLTELARRRRFVAYVNLGVYTGLLAWLGAIFSQDGWSAIDMSMFVAFAVASPWSVLGVCNATLGFWLLHCRRDCISQVVPFASAGDAKTSPRTRTAMLLTIRNEDADRAFIRLRAVKASVDATGEGESFDWFVLSDTNDPSIVARELAAFAAWRDADKLTASRLHYRRRTDNAGYKAGNIRDFCERWGADYEFMIPLDADSLMDGETILRLVRIGEQHPMIGIVQSLVVGAPSHSAFARMFQFGMRHGMRTYTMGATWWAGDCGPFWGHNALVRVAPFARHCRLPKLMGGRPILSHDQIEAVLMRRAGYEVRLLPQECGSYEDNPPSLVDFVRRDLRWCEGNMQYLKLLGTPGLLPMSRFQLVWAVSMFLGAPAWTLIIALSALKPAIEDVSFLPSTSVVLLYLTFLVFNLAPKVSGFADVALSPGGLARYGGVARFFASAVVEIASSFVIGAVTTLSVSIFLLGAPFGLTIGWTAQARDSHGLSLRAAARKLWPHLLFGVAFAALSAASAPSLLLWSLPLTLGYVVAIPFALVSASPAVGAFFARVGLCPAPEEFETPAILQNLESRLNDGRKNLHDDAEAEAGAVFLNSPSYFGDVEG